MYSLVIKSVTHTHPFWDAAHDISLKGLIQHLQSQYYQKGNSSYFPPYTVKLKSTCLMLSNNISKSLKWRSTSWTWKKSEFSILVLPFVIKPIFGFNFQKYLKLTQLCGNVFCSETICTLIVKCKAEVYKLHSSDWEPNKLTISSRWLHTCKTM